MNFVEKVKNWIKKEEVVELPTYQTPDEVADNLAGEAAELFQRAHDARERAAEVLEHAATEASEQAQAFLAEAERQAAVLTQRAEALKAVAKQRLEKASVNRKAAGKLADFLG